KRATAKEGGETTPALLESLRLEAQSPNAGRLIRQLGWRAADTSLPGSIALTIAAGAGRAPGFGLSANLAGAQIEASGSMAAGLTPALDGTVRLSSEDATPLLAALGIPTAGEGARPAQLSSPIE